MIPQSFSFYEAHGKHRSPEEISQINRQNQILENRAYQYGDPVYSKGKPHEESPANTAKPDYIPQRRYNSVFLLFRPISFFFSLFSSR